MILTNYYEPGLSLLHQATLFIAEGQWILWRCGAACISGGGDHRSEDCTRCRIVVLTLAFVVLGGDLTLVEVPTSGHAVTGVVIATAQFQRICETAVLKIYLYRRCFYT